MQGAFYDTLDDVRASASGDPWTAPQGAFANEDPWRRSKAPIDLNMIKKANSVRANHFRDRAERCYDTYAIDRIAPAVHYCIPYDDATKIDVYGGKATFPANLLAVNTYAHAVVTTVLHS